VAVPDCGLGSTAMENTKPFVSKRDERNKLRSSSHRLRSKFLASILLIVIVVFSVFFSITVPYYIETEVSMNRVEVDLEGINIYFEKNNSDYLPAGATIVIRVYNPSTHYGLLVDHFQFRYVILNGYEIKYFREFNYVNQKVDPLSNGTISIFLERTYMQGEDVEVLKNAREDSTW